MNNNMFSWWGEIFRWVLTTLILGFYIALTFFSFRGEWSFLLDFEYYTTTISSTSFAWLLRWLWSVKGLETRLVKSEDIKEKELGKDKVIQEINQKNLTDVLENEINTLNKQTKLKEYKNKCERKRNQYQGSKLPFTKRKYEYWKQERINCDKEDFNVDVVKVKYYRYDIDSMLSSTYKQSNEIETRGNLNREVLTSFRTNIITLMAFAVLGALQVFIKDFTSEDLFVLLGRMIVFVINIYSGLNLGMKFVEYTYSKDLSKDYVVMKSVLKRYGN